VRNTERAARLTTPVATRAQVADLDEEERRLLAGWLAECSVPPAVTREVRRRRLVALVASAGAAVVLAAWIGVLSVTLPDRYAAHEWRIAWIGFDVALALGFAATAWTGWRTRQLVITALIVTGTLLLCDAWFDVTLSWGSNEQLSSILAAVLVEIPFAFALWFVAYRLLQALTDQIWRLEGAREPRPPLHRVPLLPLPTDFMRRDHP
jgi:hypothetical protein